MPNWVTNKLIVEGPNSKEVMKKLTSLDEHNDHYFDFNKIIPMPDELNIVAGSLTNKCIELYLTYINPDAKHFGAENIDYDFFNKQKQLASKGQKYSNYNDNLSLEKINDYAKTSINESNLKTVEDLVAYGKNAVANVEKFGSMDWYDWSIKNWGTKWNACHTIYDEQNSPNEIVFDTAWGNVLDLMITLSKMYPENQFNYIFAEEWIGNQVGNVGIKNGEIVYGAFYEDGSEEAYEQAFELWGEDLAELYQFDKKKNTYVPLDQIDSSNEEEM